MEITDGSMHFEATMTYDQLLKAMNDIERRLATMEGTAVKAGDAFDDMGKKAESLFDVMANGFAVIGGTALASKLIREAFSVRSYFEDATSAMTVFLKSSEKAEEHLNELQDYAWYNVFDFETLVDASKQLQAFGTNVDDVIPVIEKLSNIAAGTGGDLMEFVSIYNKAKSLGQLDSRGVQQFAIRGLNLKDVLKEMGEVTSGTSVTFEQLQKAIDHVNAEGGMFANLMMEQFDNLSSLKGALEDDFSQLMNQLGGDLQDVFVKILKGAHETMEGLSENLERIGKVIIYVAGAWGLHKAALLVNVAAAKAQAVALTKTATENTVVKATVQSLTKEELKQALAMGMVTKADVANMTAKQRLIVTMEGVKKSAKGMTAAMASNIWIGIAMAIAVVINKIVEMRNEMNAVSTAYDEAAGETEEARMKFNDLMKALGKAEKGTDTYKEIVQQLNKEYKPYLGNLNLEVATLEEINEQRRVGNELLKQESKRKAQEAAIDKAYEQRQEARAEFVKRTTKLIESQGIKDGEKIGHNEAMAYANAFADVIADMDFDAAKFTPMVLQGFRSSSFSVSEESLEDYKKLLADMQEIGMDLFTGNGPKILGEDWSTNSFFQNFTRFAYTMHNTSEQLKRNGIDLNNAITGDKDGAINGNVSVLTQNATALSETIADASEKLAKLQEKARNGIDLTDDETKQMETLRSTIKSNSEEYEKLTGESYAKRGETMRKYEQQLSMMKLQAMSDSYANERAMAKLQGEQQIADMEHRLAFEMDAYTDAERDKYGEIIEEQKKLNNLELAQMDEAHRLKKQKAREQIADLQRTILRERVDFENEQSQAVIDAMEEGSAKELAQMKLDAEKRRQAILRQGEDERRQAKERVKQQWLDENIDRTEEQFYRQFDTEGSEVRQNYEKAESEIDERTAERLKSNSELTIKQQADFQKKLLANYGDYATQKESIDKKYADDRMALEKQLTKDITEEERKRVEGAITESKKEQARETFNIDMGNIDATAYFSEVDRLKDIWKAYQQYFENMAAAGASSAELNNILKEQEEAAGRYAQLNARASELEEWINNAKANNQEYKEWEEELQKILPILDLIGIKIGNTTKRTGLKSWKEFVEELKASDIISAGGEIGDVIANIGEAADSDALAGFGQALSMVGNIGAQVASGNYLGAALSLITSIGNAIAENIEKTNAFKEANRQAAIEAKQIRIDNLLQGDSGIFGVNYIQQIADYIEAMDLAGKEAKKLRDETVETYTAMSYLRDNYFAQLNALGGTRNKLFTVVDRSAFANSFGVHDEYMTLQDFAKNMDMELLDEYGNLNVKLLELFKNTYADMSEEDKKWIDNAIKYADQYAEAMEGLASYLENIFGNTVDTIVDKMFEGGLDIKDIMSDVGKQISKDLMKSMMLSEYFGEDFGKELKKILGQNGLTEESMLQVYTLWADQMQRFEADAPMWQEMAERLSTQFGFDTSAESIAPGTALSSASQESIDLLNGQMNAARLDLRGMLAVQQRMDLRQAEILLEISGIRESMDSHLDDTNKHLAAIRSNTSEGNNIMRQLGI